MLQIQEIEVEKLCPWEKNPRINDHAVQNVAGSIKAFGFNAPIICDRDFNIIAGHTRWKAAKSLGMKTVPVIALDLTETQKKAYSIADNKTAEIADWEYHDLHEILSNLIKESINCSDLGFSEAEIDALLSQQVKIDWEQFETLRLDDNDESTVLFRVKIPLKEKNNLQIAMNEYAKKMNIREKDQARKNGKILLVLFRGKNG